MLVCKARRPGYGPAGGKYAVLGRCTVGSGHGRFGFQDLSGLDGLDLFVGDILRQYGLDVLGVADGTHFGHVQPGDLNLGRDAVATDQEAGNLEQDAADDDVPADADHDFDELRHQLLGAAAVEQTLDVAVPDRVVAAAIGAVGEQPDRDYAPGAASAVDADRAHRVVNADLVEEEA